MSYEHARHRVGPALVTATKYYYSTKTENQQKICLSWPKFRPGYISRQTHRRPGIEDSCNRRIRCGGHMVPQGAGCSRNRDKLSHESKTRKHIIWFFSYVHISVTACNSRRDTSVPLYRDRNLLQCDGQVMRRRSAVDRAYPPEYGKVCAHSTLTPYRADKQANAEKFDLRLAGASVGRSLSPLNEPRLRHCALWQHRGLVRAGLMRVIVLLRREPFRIARRGPHMRIRRVADIIRRHPTVAYLAPATVPLLLHLHRWEPRGRHGPVRACISDCLHMPVLHALMLCLPFTSSELVPRAPVHAACTWESPPTQPRPLPCCWLCSHGFPQSYVPCIALLPRGPHIA